jgi:hypothetical protein
MPRKDRKELRITLESSDWQIIEMLKRETGIDKNVTLIRYAIKRALKLIELDPKLAEELRKNLKNTRKKG